MVQSEWSPSVGEGAEPLWHRLVDALEADMSSGLVKPGTRLPPHRDLAHRLSVAVGTVSRAYSEAERRGLVESHVGRGTFVAHRRSIAFAHRQTQGRINLGMNVPPVDLAMKMFDRTLEGLRMRDDRAAMFDYTFTAGLPAVREAGARWLRERGGIARASADRLIQTNGGQHALMLACAAVAAPGDTVLCDAATYAGNRTIAQNGGWGLVGVPADQRGMDPAALDRAAAETGARAVILIPTLHNPTTVTLDEARRAEIVEIVRGRDLIIIEDDVYRVFGGEHAPAPFADLAPERVIHATSLSKALSPGLRLGFVFAPDDKRIFERLLLAAQATLYNPPAINGLIFADWMERGTAYDILLQVQAEMRRRNALARAILGSAIQAPETEMSLHVWLPMPTERAHHVFGEALRGGVDLTPPEAPFIDPSAVSGLRICLGTPLDIAELEQGLAAVKSALDSDPLAGKRGVV